jgi:diketogulonate reductase-like aldo/keto reductase
MIERRFGPTDTHVPTIGQGTWQLKPSGVEALQLGIELGMTHIDTAEMYTGAEEIIAEAIRGRREKVFLVSKVLPSNASFKGTLHACDASLKRLGADYLDVYLIHWWSGSHPIAETMRAMEQLVADGKIRCIGVSNFDVQRLRQAQKALTREKIVCNQVLYHLRSRGIEHRLLPYCESQNIAVVGYSPFGQGNFPPPNSRQGKALASIASRHGKTPRQVALNFLTQGQPSRSCPRERRSRRLGIDRRGFEADRHRFSGAGPEPAAGYALRGTNPSLRSPKCRSGSRKVSEFRHRTPEACLVAAPPRCGKAEALLLEADLLADRFWQFLKHGFVAD